MAVSLAAIHELLILDMARRAKKIDKTPKQAQVDALSHEGWGIARPEGKATFIQGALPGEDVMFIPTEQKSNYAKGICQAVVQPSPDRVTPPCAHYEVCGGCSMQHMAEDKQLEFKEKVLLENLAHIGQTQPQEVLSPIKAATLGYRHKARLSVRYVAKKQAVLVGFRERLSGRYIADISNCAILHPAVGRLITPLRELVASLSNFTEIAQIEVAVGENQTVLILRHLAPLLEEDKRLLEQFGVTHSICWYLQPGGEDTVHPLVESEKKMLTYQLPDFGLTYAFEPTDFTQVNPAINQQMVARAIELLQLQSSDVVLDLFCGLGNFALAIALQAKQVVGVEGSSKMTARASMNALQNQLLNTSFFTADLFESIVNEPWALRTYDKILLDPPRAGAKALCEQIDRFNAKRIVYVSCSTATLARDARILIEKGYTLSKAGVMDMFPHTAHVESIALFEKRG